jgi:hypothetical protein
MTSTLSAFAKLISQDIPPSLKRKRKTTKLLVAESKPHNNSSSTSSTSSSGTSSRKQKKRKKKKKERKESNKTTSSRQPEIAATAVVNKSKLKKNVSYREKIAHNKEIHLSTCIIPPRTMDRISIQPHLPYPAPIKGFTLEGKERLAMLTSNYARWLVHVASACALRRIQLEFCRCPFPVPHIPKASTNKRGRKRLKPILNKVHTHEVELLDEDVERAIEILKNDLLLEKYLHDKKKLPKTISSAFLLSSTSTDYRQCDEIKVVNPFFLRR